MKQIKDIFALKNVSDDLDRGERFYEMQESGVGQYFRDCLLSDMESLYLYAGTHKKYAGAYKLLSRRFPYAIYYTIEKDIVVIVAVLDVRSNPAHTKKMLQQRK
jgi:plasmid stabilization system protein ParE